MRYSLARGVTLSKMAAILKFSKNLEFLFFLKKKRGNVPYFANQSNSTSKMLAVTTCASARLFPRGFSRAAFPARLFPRSFSRAAFPARLFPRGFSRAARLFPRGFSRAAFPARLFPRLPPATCIDFIILIGHYSCFDFSYRPIILNWKPLNAINKPVVDPEAMLNLKIKSATKTASSKYVKAISTWVPTLSP